MDCLFRPPGQPRVAQGIAQEAQHFFPASARRVASWTDCLRSQYGLVALAAAVASLAAVMAALWWTGGWEHVGARNALLALLLLGVAVLVSAGIGVACLLAARLAAERPPAALPSWARLPSMALVTADPAAQSRRPDELLQTALLGQHLLVAGQLGSRVAHDLAGPLGTISTSAQLIDRCSADPEVALLVDSIRRSVETAGRLVQSLPRLAGHRAGPAGRIELARELPAQRELLETVLGRQVGLSIEVSSDADAIEADPGELSLALVNLAFNAVKAIRRVPRSTRTRGATLGQVQLIARAAAPEPGAPAPEGAHVLICMLDDGVGVDEALAERVFEPFFSTCPPGAGWGLGLNQVAAFWQRAGGVARLRSTPGLGTAVSLRLPAAPPLQMAGAVAGQAHDGVWLRGLHLLIVDSSDEFAGFAAGLLAGRGCRLSRARDVRQALEAFESGQPAIDLVLCAAELPENVDGVALARLLRRRDPQLRIVLRGAAAAAPAAAAVPEGSRDAFVSWPVNRRVRPKVADARRPTAPHEATKSNLIPWFMP